MKILKYDINDYSGSKKSIRTLPKGSDILRVDHVDDGFYKGNFVWAIPSNSKEAETEIPSLGYLKSGDRMPLDGLKIKVKEEQVVRCPHILQAYELDGELFVWFTNHDNQIKEQKVKMVKTGQEFELEDGYRFVGLNRLWIVQELALYVFVKDV